MVKMIVGGINDVPENTKLYRCEDLSLSIYSKNAAVEIGAYVPHRLVNLHDENLTFVVESSPGSEHRTDLEPEYGGFNECMEALRKALLANAKKV